VIRLHLDLTLAEGALLALDNRAAHYLGTVMRRTEGDALAVFNATDGEWDATLAQPIRHERGSVRLGSRRRAPAPEPGPWLVLAALKRDAIDLVAEKATELGVERILPVSTRRTVAGRVNRERLQLIATEAAEQSGRLTVPRIDEVAPLWDALHAWPRSRRLFLADPGAPVPLADALGDTGEGSLLVGPEGGWDPLELDALRALPFCVPASLGPRILRAETAAIAGLALIQGLAGAGRRVSGDRAHGPQDPSGPHASSRVALQADDDAMGGAP